MPESLFLMKLQAEACSFIKKRLWHRCVPVNFAKFLRTPFLQNTSRRLLLIVLLSLLSQDVFEKNWIKNNSKFSSKTASFPRIFNFVRNW